jgi:hypothetical protein
MDIAQAKAMIASQRWHWERSIFTKLRALTSDDAIARESERLYLVLAIVWFSTAGAFPALLHSSFASAMFSMGFLIGGLILFWRSRRFAQARRLLDATETDPII